MSLFSLLALAFGMVAASADRAPRPAFALIAISSRRAARRIERRAVVRTTRVFEKPVLVRLGDRPASPRLTPLRGSIAARAPGACC